MSTSPVVSLLLLPLVLLLLLGSRCLQVRLPAPRPKAPKAELDNWIALVRTRFHNFRGSRPAGLPALLRFEPLARSPARHGASSREQGSAAWAQASDVGVREVRPHGQLGLPGGLRLRGQGARWCGQEPRTKKAREAHEKLEKGGGGSHKGQGGGGGVPTLPQPSWPCVRRGPWSVAPGAEARGGRARRRPSAHADRGLGGDDRRLQESQDRRGARHSR